MSAATIEITIPVLNEEKLLEQNLTRAMQVLQQTLDSPERLHFVIADNGSTDRTQEIAERMAATLERVRYLRLPAPGVGAALKYAWQSSKADYIGYMDIDLATDLRHVPEAMDALAEGYDVVYGSRLHRNSLVVGRTVQRTVISHSFNLVLKLYMGARFSDGMCGFKFLHRRVLPELMQRGAVSDSWFFSTEILLAAERLNLRLKELPVTWTDDSDSRVRLVALTARYLNAMRIFRARDAVIRYDARQSGLAHRNALR